MALNIDTSKPLTDEQIEQLRTRLPENLVQYYVSLSNAPQAAAEAEEAEPEAAPAKKTRGSKNDPDILA